MTLSLYGFVYDYDIVHNINYNGGIEIVSVSATKKGNLRPSIVLVTDTLINGGNGTKTNPYVVG